MWCGVKKGLNERIEEDILSWIEHIEKMNDEWKSVD